ncbi:MAG: DUF2071 domain-containing protein [Chthoniobacterales bacterium]
MKSFPVPTMCGVIARRILINFRADPDALRRILPRPFEPKLVRDVGMAGICLIRLAHLRPNWVPAALGLTTENAAHRIAVEWEDNGRRCEGVYIPRRDTSSTLVAMVGGKLFPGVHHRAEFLVHEDKDTVRVAMESRDGETRIAVAGSVAFQLPSTSIFRDLSEASEFFKRGSLGYSATPVAGCFHGLELRSFNWHVEPLAVETAESSFFQDEQLFPLGTIEPDSALLMRGVDHEWHGLGTLVAESTRSEP